MKDLLIELDRIDKQYTNIMRSDNDYDCIANVHKDFAEEFDKYAKHEAFNADLSTYTAYIQPTCWHIADRVQDAENRYKIKKLLAKSFFEWFPKYQFLEKYDLSDYPNVNNSLNHMNELRTVALQYIDHYEQSLRSKYT